MKEKYIFQRYTVDQARTNSFISSLLSELDVSDDHFFLISIEDLNELYEDEVTTFSSSSSSALSSSVSSPSSSDVEEVQSDAADEAAEDQLWGCLINTATLIFMELVSL